MEDWGEEIFAEGVGVKWKNEPVGRGGEGKIPPTPPTLTGQVSNYDPRWRHRKPDLASVPLQNNGCTADYRHLWSPRLDVEIRFEFLDVNHLLQK